MRPIPLTQEAFAPYGDVIETSADAMILEINQGYTKRYHDLAKVDVAADGGRPIINIFRSTPLPQPLTLEVMERHPLSSQAFIPLNQRPYLVAVSPPGELNPEDIKVFLAGPNQGVNYRAGTWHHFCLALDDVSHFLVIDRGGQGHNCDEVVLPIAQIITVDLEPVKECAL